MQLSVTGHHVDITEAMSNYVNSKFERLERHFDHVTNVHVIMSVEKLRQKAERGSYGVSGFLNPPPEATPWTAQKADR